MRFKHKYSDGNKVMGGAHCYDDGGAVKDGSDDGWMSKLRDLFGGSHPVDETHNPVAAEHPAGPGEGIGGERRRHVIDKAIEDAGG